MTDLTASALSAAAPSQVLSDPLSTVHYHLDFERYAQHLVTVQLSFIANDDQPILWLPSWIPGSYLMREFARHITAVQYSVADAAADAYDDADTEAWLDAGLNDDLDSNLDSEATTDDQLVGADFEEELALHRAQKISKSEWQLTEVKAGKEVYVTYEVYCFDLSVRTAYIDQERIYGNFTSLALTIEGQSEQPIEVTLSVPMAFYQDKTEQVKLACGLKATHLHTDEAHYYQLQTDSYAALIDYPFELAEQVEGAFIVYNQAKEPLVHRLFISGKHQTDIARLQQDLASICQTYVSWLGDTPFSDYTFMTYASGNDYGGLEHINSTSLIAPRRDLPSSHEPEEPMSAYQRYLGLCSHEYFHSWWVKTVRPDVMIEVDLRQEAYTPLLWVFEGFTSYIDDFMLQASGIISPKSYLVLLTEQVNRYLQTHGRHLQSVAESSFDAWIKLYRADENTGNAGISYYNKGALVALCLDLLLLQHSEGKYRLFDIVKAFYAQAKAQGNRRIGMTSQNLGEVIGGFIDAEIWKDFKARYVDGVEELPFVELLAANGTKVNEVKHNNTLPWGIRVEETPAGLQVTKVLRDSVAASAGLSAKDIIVAIDGIKADKAQLKHIAETATATVSCHAFRRDELLTLQVPSKLTAQNEWGQTQECVANPSLDKVQLALQESGWDTWLNAPYA